MNVRNLIKELQQLDPELPVILRGYEGGYYDSENQPLMMNIALNVNSEWWYGRHEEENHYLVTSNPDKYTIIPAILIS